MYPKGSNLLHTIRQVVDDDARWRRILRGLNQTFRHRIVTSRQVEEYLSWQAGIDLSRVFRQYLTTTRIPTLEYRVDGRTLRYRWTDVVPGFDLPIRVMLTDAGYSWLKPTEAWQTAQLSRQDQRGLQVDPNFYVQVRLEGATP
jgi:aminopeptidase N